MRFPRCPGRLGEERVQAGEALVRHGVRTGLGLFFGRAWGSGVMMNSDRRCGGDRWSIWCRVLLEHVGSSC